MNTIDSYMEQVDDMLKNTTDPFAQKHPDIFRLLIEIIAKENWIETGEPTLTTKQMDKVYSSAKNQTGDKTWQILGRFNVCMN